MPKVPDLDALAREMKVAQDAARHVELFTERLPDFDLETAYDVANRIHRARVAEGARPVGRKIGFTNSTMWARYGVRAPIWAHVYDTTVVQLRDTRTSCGLARFVEPKIEPEIVLHFCRTPALDASPETLLGCIDWVAHGFEIVQSHFRGWKFQAPDTVADWALHGALLVGPAQPVATLGKDLAAALEDFTVVLSRNGQEQEVGKGANALGSPLAAVAHLISVLATQPHAAPLRADELVTTGTLTAARTVRAGETWQSALRGIGLPGLAVTFSD
ncbi:MAG: fumarylacetoacetate hydrolase family protein [Burkholderiales bacterium]